MQLAKSVVIGMAVAVMCFGVSASAQTSTPQVAKVAAPVPLEKVDPTHFAKEPYVLSNGIKGTIVALPTRNPVDWQPLLHGDLGKSVTINAQLFLPIGASSRVPAVIENPGSGNLGPHHFAHAAALTSAGIAVLVMDPFFARSIDNTMVDQYGQISWATTAYDVLAATQYLRTLPEIDGARIGATGGSRGGTAVMMAAAAPISDAILGQGKGLRAVVAGYPWCGTQFRSAKLAQGAALLVLSGDRDDWVSFLQCQDAVHAMQTAGQNATIKIFPGARHAFDRAGVPLTVIPQAVTSTVFPSVYMDDTGKFYNLRTGKLDPTLTTQTFLKYAATGGFLHKGVTIGSQGSEAAEYSDEMVAFFKANLLF